MPRFDTNRMDLKERLVMLNRCAKVVKGGRRFSYAAVMVVGDGQGHVGVGMGKARETPEAIRKGIEQAKKNLFLVPLAGRTIPHLVNAEFGAAKVLLKPAAPGTGVIAGGAVRAVLEAAGVHDVLSKSLGSNNKVNVARATEEALKGLVTSDAVHHRRGITARPTPAEAAPADMTSPAKDQVPTTANGTTPAPVAPQGGLDVPAPPGGAHAQAAPETPSATGMPPNNGATASGQKAQTG